MRDNLIPFQKRAVRRILNEITSAEAYYKIDERPQVIAFRAPTGSGKTLIMATVIEDILTGSEGRRERPEAIFVWLSDSPQLNEQSKMKIVARADKIQPNQCVPISEDSFDQETLEEGHIYFLNTQKLGKSSRLVNEGDTRSFTIWETLQNTKEQKGDHLYFIIDEAHRGMRDRDAAKATTIMQKFLKGSEADHLDPMPIVIGMSATDERFRRLIGNIASVRHDVDVNVEEVRSSGLLKDRIYITYPDGDNIDDMVMLQAAVDEWKSKCDHWNYYCVTQKSQQVYPVLVIQVENRNNASESATELAACISKIEARTGIHFNEHEVVHTFGQTATIECNGFQLHHIEAADISDNRDVRVVFFKENLSTGWDCPRAETMMSFRHVKDATYIAQLLGRMIRTPLQRHIDVDDTLNEVRLFLPHFDRENIDAVMKALQDEEGGDIPADVSGEGYGSENREIWGYRPKCTSKGIDGQISLLDWMHTEAIQEDPLFAQSSFSNSDPSYDTNIDAPATKQMSSSDKDSTHNDHFSKEANQSDYSEPVQMELALNNEIDREAVADFINSAALITYDIKPFKTMDYLPSLIELASLVKNTGIDKYSLQNIQQDGVKLVEEYIQKLKDEGSYDSLSSDVKKLNLSWQIFDAFGVAVDKDREYRYYTSSDEDIDRKFREAEHMLGGYGLGSAYGFKNYDENNPSSFMVDVILFAADKDRVKRLCLYAEKMFNSMSDKYRLQFAHMDNEKYRKEYDKIVSSGNEVSEHSFRLPESIPLAVDPAGDKYYNHFFVNEDTGYARIHLNTWEKAVIDEESKRADFVCWIRNPSNGSWSLTLKRHDGTRWRSFYPDFIIVRNVQGVGYVIDILEPHKGNETDNLSKAKALVEYTQRQPTAPIGRVQLIRIGKDNVTGKERIKRLDCAKSAVKAKVQGLQSNQELDMLFLDDRYID